MSQEGKLFFSSVYTHGTSLLFKKPAKCKSRVLGKSNILIRLKSLLYFSHFFATFRCIFNTSCLVHFKWSFGKNVDTFLVHFASICNYVLERSNILIQLKVVVFFSNHFFWAVNFSAQRPLALCVPTKNFRGMLKRLIFCSLLNVCRFMVANFCQDE